MRRFLAGVVVGVLGVGAVFAFVGRGLLTEKYEFGRRMGQLDGRLEAMESLRAEFGEVPWSPRFKTLFSIKTSVAVSTVVDGVKTVRVVP